MTEMSPEEQKFIVSIQQIVANTAKHVQSEILKATFKFSPEKRWLIYSRVLNSLYASHYNLSFRTLEEQMAEVAQQKKMEDLMAKKKQAKKKPAKKGY